MPIHPGPEMAGSEKKVRGREPPIYTGAEDYEDWKLTVLSYLAMENVRYIYLLDNYPKRRATAMAPLTEDVLKGHYDGGQATADVVMTLNQRLYFHPIEQHVRLGTADRASGHGLPRVGSYVSIGNALRAHEGT